MNNDSLWGSLEVSNITNLRFYITRDYIQGGFGQKAKHSSVWAQYE